MSKKIMNFTKHENLVPVEKPDQIKINFYEDEKNNSLVHKVENEKTFSQFPSFPQRIAGNYYNRENIFSGNYNNILLNKIEEYIKYIAKMGDFKLTDLLSNIFLYQPTDTFPIHHIDIMSHIKFILNRLTCEYRCEPKVLLDLDSSNINVDFKEIYFIRVN